MGRIIKEIEVNGKKLIALFDSGSVKSYIRKDAIPEECSCVKIEPFRVGLGGKEREINERCIIPGKLEKLGFDFSAHPTDELAEEEGKKIDIIVGATAMEEWNIRLILDKKELDLTGLKKREFTEFFEVVPLPL